MGAVPRLSWLGLAAGSGGVVPLRSWRRALWVLFPAIPGWGTLLALVGRVVPRHSWRRALWLLFPVILGWGRLLAFVGWVVPRPSWRRALWVQCPAIPGWGLLIFWWGGPSPILAPGCGGSVSRLFLAGACCWLWWGGWFFANPSGAPCGCNSPPLLAGGCRCLWWGSGPSPSLGEAHVGAAPCPSLLWAAAGRGGGVVLHPSRRWALWVLFPAFPGCGLPLAVVGVVLGFSRWWALWVQSPALPGWDLLLAVVVGGGGPSPFVAGVLWVWFPALRGYGPPVVVVGGGPSPFLGGSRVGAVPRLVWLGSVAGFGGWMAPCPPWPWVLWLPLPALLVRGLPLVPVAWSPAPPGGGPVGGAPPLPWPETGVGPVGVVLCLPWRWSSGRCAPPSLAGVCHWVRWGGPLPFLVVGPVVAVSCLSWLGGVARFGGVVARLSRWRLCAFQKLPPTFHKGPTAHFPSMVLSKSKHQNKHHLLQMDKLLSISSGSNQWQMTHYSIRCSTGKCAS